MLMLTVKGGCVISCISLAIRILGEFRYDDDSITNSCIPFPLAPQ